MLLLHYWNQAWHAPYSTFVSAGPLTKNIKVYSEATFQLLGLRVFSFGLGGRTQAFRDKLIFKENYHSSNNNAENILNFRDWFAKLH